MTKCVQYVNWFTQHEKIMKTITRTVAQIEHRMPFFATEESQKHLRIHCLSVSTKPQKRKKKIRRKTCCLRINSFVIFGELIVHTHCATIHKSSSSQKETTNIRSSFGFWIRFLNKTLSGHRFALFISVSRFRRTIIPNKNQNRRSKQVETKWISRKCVKRKNWHKWRKYEINQAKKKNFFFLNKKKTRTNCMHISMCQKKKKYYKLYA